MAKTTASHGARTAPASAIDATKPLPAQGMHKPNDAHGFLEPVKSTLDIADELKGGEFVKKPELMQHGAFNLVGVSTRQNEYPKGTFKMQHTFECQLLEGENRGGRVLCSFDANPVRDRFARLVQKHGGIGPFALTTAPSDKGNDAYVFQPLHPESLEPLGDMLADSDDDLAF